MGGASGIRLAAASLRLACVLAVATLCPPAAAFAAPPSADYELLFEDNFDGTNVDGKVWNHRVGPRMDGVCRKENVSVSGGQLHIALRQESIGGKPTFTGGGVISKLQFGYGYYETLSKPFMAGRGVHSAFWQSGGAVPNNNLFEIDSYEIDSKSWLGCNNLYVHICPQGYKEVPWPLRAHVPFKFRSDGWFLDAYEYTPEGVTFYDNGQAVAHVDWPELTAAQVVWLTAINGCGKVDADKLPGETTFDYFRYYAKDFSGVNLLPNGNFEYNQDKVASNKPVCWQLQGSLDAVAVVRGEAARDQYKLRLGGGAAHEITLRQTLQFIRNGDYQITAKVRSSGGQEVARLGVSGFGGQEVSADIPRGDQWTGLTIPRIAVSNHCATIAIAAKGQAGQWLEIDDVQFMKPPRAGQTIPPPRPFELIRDPLWSVAQRETIRFTGDAKFYFFDRNVGFGPAITVAFAMTPERRANMAPIARIPERGTAGWAVQLTEQGEVIFRIGSKEKHRDVVADARYPAGGLTRVACVFNRGTAEIYIDGALVKTESGIPFTTDDATAPGRLGNVTELFDAVGDVIVPAQPKPGTKSAGLRKHLAFSGGLRDVRVYNRALPAAEIAALAAGAR